MAHLHRRPAVVLMLAAAMVGGVACSNHSEVSNSIRGLLFTKKKKTIRLAEVTKFTWDEAYMFNPYTPRSEVCKKLHIQQSDCERRVPFESKSDGEMSIAFLVGGSLVHYASHGRGRGDFTPLPALPLSPHNAIFSVVQDDISNAPDPWIKLVLISEQVRDNL